MKTPLIVLETPLWALVVKPHGMPSAPLAENEGGTLLEWFLHVCPEARSVNGKKSIEKGLLHRLDTGTEGLVLIAKTQESYESLARSQANNLIQKKYFAFCTALEDPQLLINKSFPLIIQSRFRPFGPGRKEVRPLFCGMRLYDEAKIDYETIVEKAVFYSESHMLGITCSLFRGHRHQIRSHLSYLGYPIVGDPLYNQNITQFPLQLYALGISFPDPATEEKVSFLLPLPDKMSR